MAKDERYWQIRRREHQHIQEQLKREDGYKKRLGRLYRTAQAEVVRDIEADIGRFADSQGLSMAEAKKRISRFDVEAFSEKAKRYVEERDFSDEANRELRLYNVTMRTNRLELLEARIHLETTALADKEIKMLEEWSGQEAIAEYERQAGILGMTVPEQAQLNRMAKAIISAEFRGVEFSERVWQNQKELQHGLENTIRRTIIRGENPRVAGRELQKIVRKEFGNKKYAADRIAITETARVQSDIGERAHKDTGITQFMWIAEPTACSICAGYDGEVYDYSGTGAPRVPAHPFCKCSEAAYYDSAELDKRLGTLQETIAEPFVPASTIGQANSYARDTLGVEGANYKGLDVKVANEWNRGLKDSFDRFPKLKDKIKFTGEIHERNNAVRKVLRDKMIPETTKANPNASPKAIRDAVNRHINKVTRKLKPSTNTLATSWTPKNEPYNQFSGVTINRNKGANASRLERTLERQVEAKFHAKGTESIRSVLDHEIGHQLDDMLGIGKKKEVRELFDTRTKEELTNDLARYVWDNNNADKYSEMVAEAWSEYVNNPEPREIAKTIGSIIEREYNSIY